MAKSKPLFTQTEDKSQNALEIWESVRDKPTPETFKMGRAITLQLAKIERDLFTDLEERESGNYIVSGLTRKVTETDFYAFSLAVGKILYNQSYQSGNIDTNSGLTKLVAPKILDQTGHSYYGGEIITTLKDLCRFAYGEETPNKVQRAAMATLIDTLHNNPVVVTFPNGDEIEAYLCVKMFRRKREKDNAIYYHLILNPIFCENVKRNFAEFPQDITNRLTAVVKQKTEAHYRLLMLLGKQDKDKPFTRNINVLLDELGLMEAYKKDRGRTEKQLLALFDNMREMGVIKDYNTETTIVRRKERISKVRFILIPKAKKNEQEQITGKK